MNPMTHILRIDASARVDGSVTRGLTTQIINHIGNAKVTSRDLSFGVHALSQDWIGANFTPSDQRSAAQSQTLAPSDALVAEVQAADTLVIGLPIYNFGIPASLKSWIDQIARVGVTFHYTEDGPKGLLQGKRAIVAVASGGTPVGSEIDFATPYLRHALGFVGITDVTFVTAVAWAADADATLRAA